MSGYTHKQRYREGRIRYGRTHAMYSTRVEYCTSTPCTPHGVSTSMYGARTQTESPDADRRSVEPRAQDLQAEAGPAQHLTRVVRHDEPVAGEDVGDHVPAVALALQHGEQIMAVRVHGLPENEDGGSRGKDGWRYNPNLGQHWCRTGKAAKTAPHDTVGELDV
jgi:hypothetical protein